MSNAELLVGREPEQDVTYVLNPNARQFIGRVIDEDISERAFSEAQIDQLINGFMVLKGEALRREKEVDFRQLLEELLCEGSSVAKVARANTGNDYRRVYNKFVYFFKQCNGSLIDVSSIDDIMNLGLEYVPVDIDRSTIKETISSSMGGFATMGEVRVARSPRTSAINNPFSSAPGPTPRDISEIPYDWQTDALCAQTDVESFFVEKGGSTREAKRICIVCDVGAQCLQYVLANGDASGISAGFSPQERKKLAKALGTNMIDFETAKIQFELQRQKNVLAEARAEARNHRNTRQKSFTEDVA